MLLENVLCYLHDHCAALHNHWGHDHLLQLYNGIKDTPECVKCLFTMCLHLNILVISGLINVLGCVLAHISKYFLRDVLKYVITELKYIHFLFLLEFFNLSYDNFRHVLNESLSNPLNLTNPSSSGLHISLPLVHNTRNLMNATLCTWLWRIYQSTGNLQDYLFVWGLLWHGPV